MKYEKLIEQLERRRIKRSVSYSIDKEISLKIVQICKERNILPSHLVNEILRDYLK